ncbi:MAG: HAD family hydrolase [Dehalococcoidia bacterium]
MTTTLVLWDIDNTLLYTGGAGSVGMRRAFQHLYGIDDAFRRVEFSGRTDTAILLDALREHHLEPQDIPGEIDRFVDAYIPQLETALQEMRGALMPGVLQILERLSAHDGVALGLGTGNFRRGGRTKLSHYGIEQFFPGVQGGFGEDSPDRTEVIRLGIERMTDGARPARIVVVGDTPHDVSAACANGAFALAVATGRNSAEELRSLGADEALDDLSHVERVVSIILG